MSKVGENGKLRFGQKKVKSFFYTESKRPWFFKKNGEIGYVYTKPVNIKGKVKKKKAKKFIGSLQNTGFDMNKSSQKARALKSKLI